MALACSGICVAGYRIAQVTWLCNGCRITASGIVAPLLATTHVSPELLVLAVGAGSVFMSHVNDTGFWMFKEFSIYR